MDKNHKSMIFLAMIFVMVVSMLVLYNQYLQDKPAIEAQQNLYKNQPVLTPEQMANGVKNFIDTTTSNIHPPPGGLP